MTEKLRQAIMAKMPELQIKTDEPLKNHCSFRIGGPADIIFVNTEAELLELMALLKAEGVKPLILGKGTNMLFADEGLARPVIRLAGSFCEAKMLENGCIEAGGAISLASLACLARDNSLTGLEFAHGIPGALGGAIYMNAGAYGGEMKDVLESVRFYSGDTGEIIEKPASELGLAYRTSCFEGREDIILSAVVRLAPGAKEEISGRMQELIEKRKTSQPLDKPSAGSTFKRPAVGYAAALIDECGLKGFAVGDAQVSEKHAGFVVNNGGASCADVLELMDKVKEIVLREKGIELCPEVRIIRD